MTTKRTNVLLFMLSLLGSYGIAELHHGDPIPNGGIVRLTHWATGKNLVYQKGQVGVIGLDHSNHGNDNWIIQMLPMIGCLEAGNEVTGNQRVRFKHVASGLTLHYNDQGVVSACSHVDGKDGDVWYVRNDGSPEIGGSLRFETFVPNNSLQRCGGVLPENEVTVQSSRLSFDEQTVLCSTAFDDNDWWVINPPAKTASVCFSIRSAWLGKVKEKKADMRNVTEKVVKQFTRDGFISIPGGDNWEMLDFFNPAGRLQTCRDGWGKRSRDQELLVEVSYKDGKGSVFFAASELVGLKLTVQDVQALAAKGLFDGSGYWPGRRPISVHGKTFTIVHPALLKERGKNEMYLCVEPNWDDRVHQGVVGDKKT